MRKHGDETLILEMKKAANGVYKAVMNKASELAKSKSGVWNTMYAWAGGVLAIVVLIVMTFFILDIFSGGTNPIFTANTYAANATNNFKVGLTNAVAQVPNAGKIAGVAVIISTFVLIGVGGYAAYSKTS